MLDWLGPTKDLIYLAGVVIIVGGWIYKVRKGVDKAEGFEKKLDAVHVDVTGKFTAIQTDIRNFQEETRLSTQENTIRIAHQEKRLQDHLDECHEDKKELSAHLDNQFNRLHEKINNR